MNAIDYLVRCIEREIPREIIRLAFTPKVLLGTFAPSIPHILQDEIIEKWVWSDTNLIGGIETTIDLSNANFQSITGGLVVNIHPSLTAGRQIISILSVSFGYGVAYNTAATIASAASGPDKTTDARVRLIGPNVIFIEGGNYVNCTTLRCLLENNERFTNITPRLWPLLADLCVLATKAHVYNWLLITLSNAVVIQGVDMGRIASIIEGYADSITMYKETLGIKWRKANMMADPISHDRFIRMQMPR